MVEFKTILFDQLAPIAIYKKIQTLYPEEITLLFESAINTNEGNFSFIIIGAREKVIRENNQSFHINESGEKIEIEENPLDFYHLTYYHNIVIVKEKVSLNKLIKISGLVKGQN